MSITYIPIEYKLFRIILAIFCSCILNSCTTSYHFIPPASESGKIFVSKCEIQVTLCKNRLSKEHRVCKEEMKQDDEFCRTLGNPGDNKGDNPSRCTQRYLQKSCAPISNFSCSENYRQCYQECGGKVAEIK